MKAMDVEWKPLIEETNSQDMVNWVQMGQRKDIEKKQLKLARGFKPE